MKKRILQIMSLALLMFTLASFENTASWVPAGTAPNSYYMGENITQNNEGAGIVTIKSKTNSVNGFGALMHQLSANTYQGKRVRISGIIKTENVGEWGGFWINANQSLNTQAISLQNVKHSSYTGNLKGYAFSTVVVDVPAQSSGIAYGAVLKGAGQVWVGRVMFEIVDNSVPLTN